MTKPTKYVPRGELLKGIQKTRQALEQDYPLNRVIKYLRNLEERAQITWNDSQKTEAHNRAVEQVSSLAEEQPGVTFSVLAEEIGLSVNYLKKVVDNNPRLFRKDIRQDKKGLYGRKPYGVWLRDGG